MTENLSVIESSFGHGNSPQLAHTNAVTVTAAPKQPTLDAIGVGVTLNREIGVEQIEKSTESPAPSTTIRSPLRPINPRRETRPETPRSATLERAESRNPG